MKIIYIHGVGSSPTSFNFIKEVLKDYQSISISYCSEMGFYRNLDNMKNLLSEEDDDLFLVSHSFGGIYSIHLLDLLRDKIIGGITLSTPYGGIESADAFKHLCISIMLHDVGPFSQPIREAEMIEIGDIPWVSIITTGGKNPILGGSNDGVVTYRSMKKRIGTSQIEVDLNHFEVLLSMSTIGTIRVTISDALRIKEEFYDCRWCSK